MNQITFKRVIVALYLAYSIATDTIIWGGAVYYFFFHQTGRKTRFFLPKQPLIAPGRAKPVFVNENNALHATFKP